MHPILNRLLKSTVKFLQFCRLCDENGQLSITNALAVNGIVWFNLVMYKAIFGPGLDDLANIIGAVAALAGGSVNYGLKRWQAGNAGLPAGNQSVDNPDA